MSTDPDIARLREAYPEAGELSDTRLAALRGHLVEAIEAIEGTIEGAAGAHTRVPRARRWPALAGRRGLIGVATAVAMIIAVALGLISLSSPSPHHAGAAETRAVLRGVDAGLAVPAGRVLEFADATVATFAHGSTRSMGELWEDTSYPYDERNVARVTSPAKLATGTQEWAIVDNVMQLYDPRRNTIYTDQPTPYTVRPSTQPGRYRLTPTQVTHPPTITITASQLRALRDGQDTIISTSARHVSVVPYRSILHESFLVSLRRTALALLRSGHAKVASGVQFRGHAAIAISGPGPIAFIREETYYVAPGSYRPLGFVQRMVGETATTQITTYRLLPGTTANRALVTLPGAHPGARIDTSPVDYAAASDRIFR
jgi:hypothetical protein